MLCVFRDTTKDADKVGRGVKQRPHWVTEIVGRRVDGWAVKLYVALTLPLSQPYIARQHANPTSMK